jgi:hypothetical protein
MHPDCANTCIRKRLRPRGLFTRVRGKKSNSRKLAVARSTGPVGAWGRRDGRFRRVGKRCTRSDRTKRSRHAVAGTTIHQSTSPLHHQRRKDVTLRASQSRVFGLDKRNLQNRAILRNPSNLTRSWSRGKRFESARRLSLISLDKPITRSRECCRRVGRASLHHRR